MKLLNALERAPEGGDANEQKAAVIAEGFSILLRVLAPITPHISHTLWTELGYGALTSSAHPWPLVDEVRPGSGRT